MLMSWEASLWGTITQNKPNTLPKLAASFRGCEVLQVVMQIFTENQTLSKGLSKFYVLRNSFAKGANACSSSRSYWTDLEKCRTWPIMHTCVDFATLHLWLHWTLKGSPNSAKAANVCDTFRRWRRAKLSFLGGLCTKRGKGGTLALTWVICI